jgi:hypothetical protein
METDQYGSNSRLRDAQNDILRHENVPTALCKAGLRSKAIARPLNAALSEVLIDKPISVASPLSLVATSTSNLKLADTEA